MRPDDPEFLIAQYADGSLDPAGVAEAEAVLRRDAGARAALAAYRAVDAALASVPARLPVPAVRWDQFASRIGGQVAAAAGAAPLAETVEEQLSRLAAGDVSADERAVAEAALAADPAGRLVLAEYASLEQAFAAVRASPLPDVRWDAFAGRVSAAIDAAAVDSADEAAAEHTMKLVQPAGPAVSPAAAAMHAGRPAVLGRIGRVLAQPRRLAVAACLLVAASLAGRLALQGGGPNPVGPTQTLVTGPAEPVQTSQSIVVGPSVAAGGDAVVHVGPPAGADAAVVSEALRDDVVSRPGSAMIASEKAALQDTPDQNASDATALFPR